MIFFSIFPSSKWILSKDMYKKLMDINGNGKLLFYFKISFRDGNNTWLDAFFLSFTNIY